jgi:hypothetical protein
MMLAVKAYWRDDRQVGAQGLDRSCLHTQQVHYEDA